MYIVLPYKSGYQPLASNPMEQLPELGTPPTLFFRLRLRNTYGNALCFTIRHSVLAPLDLLCGTGAVLVRTFPKIR